MNAYTLRLEKGDSHAVIMHAADPLSGDESNMHLLKQNNIPADALWLIVPTSNYRAPSTFWGQMPERHNKQTMPLGPTAQECDDVGEECLIMGAVLRNGPFFSANEWREYYTHTFHMSDGAPTGSA